MSTDFTSPLNTVSGQDFAVGVLKTALSSKKIAGSYLFVGPSGVGKYSTAQAFAACLADPTQSVDLSYARVKSGTFADVRSVGPVPPRRNIAVAQLWPRTDSQEYRAEHSLLRDLHFEPLDGAKRVFIISNADGLSVAGSESANSILKSLEEPPPYAHFILTSSSASAMLPTIISRCHVISFHRLSDEIVAKIVEEKSGLEPEKARFIANLSSGSAGRALQLATVPGLLDAREKLLLFAYGIRSAPHSAFARLAEDFRNLAKLIEIPDDETNTTKDSKPSTTRSSTVAALEILQTFYRDLLARTLHQPLQSLINRDKADIISMASEKCTPDQVVLAIRILESAKRLILSNANNQIGTELLFMKLTRF